MICTTNRNQNKKQLNGVRMKCFIFICLVASLGLAQSAKTALGGWEDVDANDEVSLRYAEASVEELDRKSNSLYKNKLITLKSVKMQVVEGLKYQFVYDMGETECSKYDEDILELCKLRNGDVKECTVVLWVQPWMKYETPTLLSDDCVEKQEIDKSQMVITGTEEKELDMEINENAVKKPENVQTKPLLGGGDHDVGNYGEFMDFTSKYNKVYKSKQEKIMRFKIFRENMKKVAYLQSKEQGDARYGATEFADMSEMEFRKTHLTPKWKINYDPMAQIAEIPKDVEVPSEWDWRNRSAVTPVKNQGSCGSCWAFSTTGNIEGQWAIQKGKLLSLSEQELVDCDKVDQGCNGGLPVDAYKAIMKLGGIESEKDYPYEGDDEKCSFNRSEATVKVKGYVNISSDEADMAAWLYKNGPISIGINAMAMQFYFGGVSHPWSFMCSPEDLDHGVLIVGYGVKETGLIFKKQTPYWIIKNSWGPGWGEDGYYLVYRGAGVCGLNQMPTSATV